MQYYSSFLYLWKSSPLIPTSKTPTRLRDRGSQHSTWPWNNENRFSRAVIKRRGPGISPGYYEQDSRILSKENKRKIEPKEIPSCFIPRLLVIFTLQLEILVTTLIQCKLLRMETTRYKVTFLGTYRSSQYFKNLTKFALIWVKNGQKSGYFFVPDKVINGQKSGYFFVPDKVKMAPAKEK